MKKRWFNLLAIGLWLLAGWTSAQAQEQTVGLFLNDARAFQGYTLIAPHQHPSTYLIDIDGQIVNDWQHEFNVGSTTLLLENGNLLRASRAPNGWTTGGGRGGRIEEITWDGNVVWQFDYVDSLYTLHHDIVKMPNGNVLTTVWELRSFEDLVENGHDPATLTDSLYWTEKIIEFRPLPPDSAEIVWQWDAWDHMIQDFDATKANFGVVSENPHRVDINTGDGGDWLHINAIGYNPQLDHIVMSISFFSEFWVIDHSTTTEQAAGSVGGRMGKGGDILYRWGNPEMYKAGGPEDRRLFFNHSTAWIEPGLPGAGNLMLFDNGRDRTDMQYSTVHELRLPYFEDYDGSALYMQEADGTFTPPELIWSYSDPGVFYSNFISGQQRLANGNTLIDEGMRGRVFEVTLAGEIVWEYVNPVVRSGPLAQGDAIPPFSPGNERQQNTLFRAYRYGPDYAGLAGKDLTPKGLIELMPTAVEGADGVPTQFALGQNYPNPFNPATRFSFSVPRPSEATVSVYNMLGQRVRTVAQGRFEPGTHTVRFDAGGLPSGVYLYRLEAEGFTATRKMLLIQ